MATPQRAIGLMSGTAMDGIDAACVEIAGEQPDGLELRLLAGERYPYPPELRSRLAAVCEGSTLSLAEWARLDDAVAHQFARGAQHLQRHCPAAALIGSHGQTAFHRPPVPGEHGLGYSLQLGRGAAIAYQTGLPTVSNFRAADIAAGGHGAPLVPKVDACLLGHPHRDRCIQNIGGISNVTYLPAQRQPDWAKRVLGWDAGPGNALLDLAVQQLSAGEQSYDRDGQWAAQGTPCQPLVRQWLQQAFFRQPPPKSTGRELFGKRYLQQCWQQAQAHSLGPADWLATLTELTAAAIANSYRRFLPQLPDEVLLCGGGRHNTYLRTRLQALLAPAQVLTTDWAGLDGDFKEAIAFAVLADWRHRWAYPGNLPPVTGAQHPVLLGECHPPAPAGA